MGSYSGITACSYNLLHVPELSFRYGSTPEAEREAHPDSDFIRNLEASFRSFDEAAAYIPNQVFIGNIDPLNMPERPWSGRDSAVARNSGPYGDILDEVSAIGLLKFSDMFDLVLLESGFAASAKKNLEGLGVLKGSDLSKFDTEVSIDQINEAINTKALPLYYKRKIIGCVKAAHPDDLSLRAHVIFENLASKAGAVYSVLKLIALSGTDPASVDYIIETSEEACGDANQRGGGNFAKAIGELSGLKNATGSDTRSFCAGPVHGILQAASLVKAGTFRKVIVAAGGTTAKLAMNSRKHIEKGFPVLEDCMGAYALLIEGGDSLSAGKRGGIIIRNDLAGIHRIGSGSSPQNVIQSLVADPLEKAGKRFDEIGYYAPELHNPEITEAGGAGNVTLANLKMVAAMAVMKKQIERSDINDFIDAHGSQGWAPTQGHIPSGIPALGWIMKWFESGRINNAMIIGKGSLFLGRMTGLFDGVSIILESGRVGGPTSEKTPAHAVAKSVSTRKGAVKVGLTIPGSESGAGELLRAAAEAETVMPGLDVVTFGDESSEPGKAHGMMEKALEQGDVDSVVTFHYPFPVGTATVGHTKAPGSGRDIFIASTTGISDTNRVVALIKNAVAGIAAAKAWGIVSPSVGVLNLDGARAALQGLKRLKSSGYGIELAVSARGDDLLRGNDILAGTADVIVCDTLSGNAFMKLLTAYSSGGMLEVSGSGYGPGLGAELPLVNIISRAAGSAAVVNAIIYSARMALSGLQTVYSEEYASALKAGLSGIIEENRQPETNAESGSEEPEAKTVEHEIEGIDVLQLEDAVKRLKADGIYCEAGMGCTGPVVMIAVEDVEPAKKILIKQGFIEEA